MEKEELIKHCRYYKGEQINPYNEEPLEGEGYDNMRAKAWFFEKLLVVNIDNEECDLLDRWKQEYLYLTDYGCGIVDEVPECLKACVLGLYLHRNELPQPEEFEPFYNSWKHKQL